MRLKLILSTLLIGILVFSYNTQAQSYQFDGDYLDLNGDIIKFSSFKGKPVLIDATATWCGPCKKQIASLQEVYTNYSDSIHFLTLSVSPLSDTIQKMGELQDETEAGWLFGIDYDSEFMNRMKVAYLPTIYFLDDIGNLITKFEGYTEASVIINSINEYFDNPRNFDLINSDISFWSLITINFGIGVLTSLSPCLFPLFPSFIAISVKNKSTHIQSISSAFSLIFGMLVALVGLSLVANYTLMAFLIANYLYFITFQGILLIISGLLLIKTPSFIYRIRLPSRFEQFLTAESSTNFLILSFLLGLAYSIIAAPCALGYFITLLVTIIGKSILTQIALITSFSLGAGLFFVIYSIFAPTLKSGQIDKLHKFSHRISLVLGSIILGFGIWIIYTIF